MNARSVHTLLIVITLSMPIVGALATVAPTAAQNSSVDIIKVARVDENFLEVDVANYGQSDVWVSIYGSLYVPASNPPYYVKHTDGIYPYFVNDVYHYTVLANGEYWSPVPAGQTTRLFTQGYLQLVDKWVVYNSRVYENGKFYQLYPAMKVANVETGYDYSRVPPSLFLDGRHSSTDKCYPCFLDDPRDYAIERGYNCSLMFDLVKGFAGIDEVQRCGKPISLYIDNHPAPGQAWIAEPQNGLCGMVSTGLRLSPQQTATLSPGMHLFTANFFGDSVYGPASCKFVFKVVE